MQDELGQILMIELPKSGWRSPVGRLLQDFSPAGLVLRELPSAASVAELAHEASTALGSTPFLAIEDEGEGPLSNLLAPLPRGNHQSLTDVERASDLIGRAMATLGLNLNFAPSVDLPDVSVEHDPARTRGENRAGSSRANHSPIEIALRGEAFLQGLARHRILGCARYFPGLPEPLRNSGPELGVIGKPMAALWREDLLPYRRLADKAALVQMSHAAYKAYDYEFPRPAALSPGVVDSLLRVKIGYNGVAVADASAVASAARIEIGEAAVQVLAAGCDLLVVNGEESTLGSVKKSLTAALESGRLRPERIEQALARVTKARKGLLRFRKQASESDIARLRSQFREFSSN